jgi:drug/metabolite transporter (DMT)-like permease
VLSWQGSIDDGGLAGPFLIAAACLAWGVDNNLTRKVALSDPVQIAMWKGLIAGGVNLALAALVGAPWPAAGMALTAGVVGLLGYGVSITLFVHALRRIGTARTGAYFSTAPFLGAALAVAWLGEPVTPPLVAAGMLMAIGVGLHLTERHEHAHEHPATAHSHRHRHDEHHRHAHGPDDPAGEPHTHWHAHPAMHHRHAHYPDAHHRHRH